MNRLVGRQADLERLQALCRTGQGVSLVIVAEPEVGRSRLLQELSQKLGGACLLRPGRSVGELLAELKVPVEHADRPESLATALRRAVAGAVLLVDDFERLDSLSQRALEKLAMFSPPARGGWVLSVTAPDAELFGRCARYPLGPLGDLDLRGLIDLELGRAQEDWVIEHAQGSPRRVKLLTLVMRMAGAVPPGEPELLPVLEALEPPSLALLTMACLAEEPFSFEVVARAAGQTVEQALQNARVLRDGGLLEDGRVGPPAIRKQLAASLPDRVRRAHHATLAEALAQSSPALRGRQLAWAGKTSDAAWLLMEGGRLAHAQGLLREALGLWEAATGCLLLGDPDVGSARIQTLLALGRVSEAERLLPKLNDSPEVRLAAVDIKLALKDYEGALSLCGSGPEMEVRRSRAMESLDRRSEAIAALERARPLESLQLARLYLAAGEVLKLQQILEPLLPDFEALLLSGQAQQLGGRGGGRLEEAAAAARVPEQEARVRMLQARSLSGPEALEPARRAVELLRPGGESPELIEALELLARLSREDHAFVEVQDVCDVLGTGRARARLALGRFRRESDRMADAIAPLREGLELDPSDEQEAELLTELARCLRPAEEALTAAEHAVSAARTSGNEKVLALALLVRAELLLDRQQWALAQEALGESQGLPLSQRGQQVRLYESLARLHEEAARLKVEGFSAAAGRKFRQLAREADRDRPARKRPIWPWAAGLALLVAGSVFALWPRAAVVSLSGSVPGAEALVDGQRYPLPARVRLAAGPHEVKVIAPGYVTFRERVELTAGQTLELAPSLAKAAGTLRIASQPPGAKVFLDGQQRGVTPLELTEVPAGKVKLKLVRQGYGDQTESVDLGAGEAKALSIKLVKKR